MKDLQRRNRRRLIKGIGAGLALTTVGCAPVESNIKPAYPRPYSRKPWAAPRISMDAVIRVIVGHRPYRSKGFRVEREDLDGKTIIHNYGHGGGGLSLGWGSSALAVREAASLSPGDVAVMGSGIMGLCTARLLQDAGCSVTIYTRDVYRHSTSNVAAGEWGPFSTHSSSIADAAFLAQLDWAARVSHHAYTNLTGAKYGIRWMEAYRLHSSPREGGSGSSFDDLFGYRVDLNPGEHPFGDWYAKHTVTMQIDPGTLLRQLTADFQLAGGQFVIQNFGNLEEVMTLMEPVIFNCTGLGSAALFEDSDLVPAKGQLVFLPPDSGVDYMTFGGGQNYGAHGFMHMFPRTDAVVLGGLYRRGDASHTIEASETERIVQEHQKLFEGFDG
ncbi:MAG: FAD-dependent oxidoreductase [Pseudomonadota bacterium]